MAMDSYCAVNECSNLASVRHAMPAYANVFKGTPVEVYANLDLCSEHADNPPVGTYAATVIVRVGDAPEG